MNWNGKKSIEPLSAGNEEKILFWPPTNDTFTSVSRTPCGAAAARRRTSTCVVAAPIHFHRQLAIHYFSVVVIGSNLHFLWLRFTFFGCVLRGRKRCGQPVKVRAIRFVWFSIYSMFWDSSAGLEFERSRTSWNTMLIKNRLSSIFKGYSPGRSLEIWILFCPLETIPINKVAINRLRYGFKGLMNYGPHFG